MWKDIRDILKAYTVLSRRLILFRWCGNTLRGIFNAYTALPSCALYSFVSVVIPAVIFYMLILFYHESFILSLTVV